MPDASGPDDSPPQSQLVLYQSEDGQSRMQVRLEGGTVWLTQCPLAEPFQKDVRTINEHIQNILEEGELDPGATIRKFRIVQTEGTREVTRIVEHYNLEMTIAVGYRVRSHRGTQFRRWATERLREYLVKGLLDAFLQFNERDVLQNAGRVSTEVAKRLALGAYERFNRRRLAAEACEADRADGHPEDDFFDAEVRRIERTSPPQRTKGKPKP